MIRRLISLLFFILMMTIFYAISGCSANYHLKKSKYHLERAKAKGAEIFPDTIKVPIKVPVPEVKIDTILQDVGDTITLEKERLKIIYKRDTITNEVYLSGECKADTIIKEVPVSIQETVYIEKTLLEYFGINQVWEKVAFWLGIVLICALFILLNVYKI